MAPNSPPSAAPRITRLEFDANRTVRSHTSEHAGRSLIDDDVSFMGEVANGIIDRDRRRMRTEAARVISFICAVLSCLCAGSITSFSLYGPYFQTALGYSQYEVNAVSIVAELAMYLPVPLFGYLCDRYSPQPLSLLAAALFGVGYLLAAFTFKAGPTSDHGGEGWPFWVMVLAFVGVGSGTSCMYLSAVATCAKNFAHAKYRGFMLAVPIAAFGLSGMWLSQVGDHLLSDRLPDGRKGGVNVFKYFIFLAGVLIGIGVVGTFALRIVDEEGLIEHGIEELERSGLLEESEFFRHYGTTRTPPNGEVEDDSDTISIHSDPADEDNEPLDLTASAMLKRREEQALLHRKKTYLLNYATSNFLSDRSMWLLAAGFFLLTGPGESYINNLGTIIPTLTPKHYFDVSSPPAGTPSTHVSIIALTSTFARLFTGTLSDLFAPPSNPAHPPPESARFSFSRLVLLLPSAVLLLLSFVNLAVPALTNTNPSLFLLSSGLLGLGYGASFSLVPIIVSVVWDVENFATNWGIVAMMPAGGAAVWSIVYSVGYSRALDAQHARATFGGGSEGNGNADGDAVLELVCRGYECYGGWAWGCAGSVAVAIVLWTMAWRVWKQRQVPV